MIKIKLVLAIVVIVAVAYYVTSGEMPNSEPTANNTLVVGKVEYYLAGDYNTYSSSEFELTIRTSKTGSFKVTTDDDGFFSFAIWSGSKVWITEISSGGVKALSIPNYGLRRLKFVSAESGVSNIGTVYWRGYGSDRPALDYGYNTGTKHKKGFAQSNPGSPWLQEAWHRVRLESSNNNR